MSRMPERRLTPPPGPDPIDECYQCGEEIYPEQEVYKLDGNIFDELECAAEYIEENWKDYEPIDGIEFDDDYTILDFTQDIIRYHTMPSEFDLKMLHVDAKLEEQWLNERSAS